MKRYYKRESQREKDFNYAQALVNSSVYALRKQERDKRVTLWDDIMRGRDAQRHASLQAAKARMLWTTKNQQRLIRVFA